MSVNASSDAPVARRSPDDLRALAATGADELAHATSDEIVAWAAQHFPHSLAVACSMADAVLPHVVARVLPGVDVLFLDTGYHFAETLQTRDEVARRLPVRVVDVRPRLSVAEQDEALGPDLFARDPGRCCGLRKVEPLREHLAGYEAWVTGVRRDEGPTRAQTPPVVFDEANGLVKINPLIDWSYADLVTYAQVNELPENALIAQGYPSIGCAPCTRPVAPGEDPRAGRWAGFEKTECGLHPG